MKKVKRMMFGGVSKAVGNAAKNAAAKAPVPPPDVQKMIAGLPRGSTVAGPIKNDLSTVLPQKSLPSGMTFGLGSAAQANPKIAPKIGGMLGGVAGLGSAAQNNPKIPAIINTSRLLTGNPVTKKVRPFGMKEGGSVSSASKRADGCAVKGKTRGKMV